MSPPGNAADAIDRAQLGRMGKEVGEQALRHYLALFCELLDGRVERIERDARDAAGGDDRLRAALDLYVSSDMLGARRLATAASEVAVLLRDGVPVGAGRLAALREEAGRAGAVLRRVLAGLDRPGPGPGSGSGPKPGPGPKPG